MQEEFKDGKFVEYTLSDTMSMLVDKCLIAFNVKESIICDLRSQSSNSSQKPLGQLFDKEYSQVTMMREIEPNQVYYLEVNDEDLNHFLINPTSGKN